MKEIGEAFVRLARATHGAKGSAILLNAGADLRDIAEQLLKERDLALEGKKLAEANLAAAELRAEAYREVAVPRFFHFSPGCYSSATEQDRQWVEACKSKALTEAATTVDAEAARILEAKKEGV